MRGKAMNLIAERVKVTDPKGDVVDITAALAAPVDASASDDAEDAEPESAATPAAATADVAGAAAPSAAENP